MPRKETFPKLSRDEVSIQEVRSNHVSTPEGERINSFVKVADFRRMQGRQAEDGAISKNSGM